MVKLIAENNGYFTNVHLEIDGKIHTDECFTVDHHDMEWGTAPEDNFTTWSKLCTLGGFNAYNIEDELNKLLTKK